MNEIISQWEHKAWEFLMNGSPVLPKRMGKLIAMYYPDARVRKRFASYIGLELGDGSFANYGLKVVPNEHEISVHIGKNVSIAPNVTFLCGAEPNNGREIKTLPYVKEKLIQYADIWVDDEAWLGAGCILFPGITVGRCAIIGAGSVLRGDADAYGIYAGVPARKIRDLREER